MRGQIIEKSKGVWLCRVQTRDIKGKLKSRSKIYRGTKQDAEKLLTQLLSEKDKGIIVSPKQNLNQFLDLWLIIAKTKLHSRTYADYSELLTRYVREHLGKVRLEHIKAVHLQKLYSEMQSRGLSPRVIRHTNSILRSAFNYAVGQEILTRNPTKFVELPRLIQREMTVLSQEEAKQLLDSSKGERLSALFSFLLLSGCRPEEALGLMWKDLDFEKSTVIIRRVVIRHRKGGGFEFNQPKTKKSNRTLPLSISLIKELEEHRIRQDKEKADLGNKWKEYDLVFPSQVGTPLTMPRVTRVFKRIKKKAEIVKSLRLYDLRHSTASFLLQANVNPKVVSERLGHATVVLTLDTYTHVLPNMQEQATQYLEDMIFQKVKT